MDSIEQYFQEEFIIEKNRIKEIEDLLKDVLKTLCFCNENGWPYEIEDNKTNILPENYSHSTSTMILFVLSKFLNKIDEKSPIIPNIKWEYEKEFKIELDNVISSEKQTKYIDYLIYSCNNLLKANPTRIVNSSTFGENDPLTLSWIAEIIANEKTFPNEFIVTFTKIAFDKIKTAFDNPHSEKSTLNLNSNSDDKSRRSTNHIFPLLRVIHLYKTIVQNDCFKINSDEIQTDLININNKVHTILFENLQNRINQQISYSVLQNSLFDTAELVLSIEGIILIDDKRRLDENILTKAFEILKINQKNNLYWRPLKPFMTSPQGDILLPLSIEIANSLLRICKHLEKKKKYYFYEFFDIFENYSKWLLSNVSQCNIENNEYRGWRSEHVQKQNVIHPWETAQVVIYLMNYKSMIQDYIAYKSLKKSGLSCNEKYVKEGGCIDIDIWGKKWDVDTDYGFPNCYKEISTKFIEERKNVNGDPQFSMLLYGPPGTGKSSIAEDLAETLNWRLITITPSDFIKHGEADIEGRAKSIFKTLVEQKDCVILFDEIDRLILDRDSTYYAEQSDMFQFMTPSMLVKIKDLRVKEKSIFIIATNYEERIDSAIKRSGRIDEKFLVNTLNFEQRLKKLNLFLKEEKEKKDLNIPIDIDLKSIAENTFLYTWTELKSFVKNVCKSKNDLSTEENLKKELLDTLKDEEPTIKLSNYKRRFQSEKKRNKDKDKEEIIDSQIFPYREFLALVFLKLESNHKLSETENELLERVLKSDPNFKLSKYFKNKGSNLYNLLKPLCPDTKE